MDAPKADKVESGDGQKMDWGTSNPHGYLATSLPWRHRLFYSAQSGLCAALIVAWFLATSIRARVVPNRGLVSNIIFSSGTCGVSQRATLSNVVMARDFWF